MGRKRENIHGQLSIMDFSQYKDEGEVRGFIGNEYPIKILVLEKKSKEDVTDNYIDYSLLYDDRDVMFLDKLEVFKDRGRKGLNVLEKIDYIFVLLTKELLEDYNIMGILMANYNVSEKNKIKPIIKENSLRQHTTRIKIYKKMEEDMEELKTSNIINKDIQSAYNNIKNIYDNLDDFFTYALAMDIWEDVSIPEKITNYLWEDDKKILYRKKKNKSQNGEENSEKNYEVKGSKKVGKNIDLGRQVVAGVYIDAGNDKNRVQVNYACDRGTINGKQNNCDVSNG